MDVDLYDIDIDTIKNEVSRKDLDQVDNFGVELSEEERLRAAFWIRRQLDSTEKRLTTGEYITMDVTVTSIGRMIGVQNNVTGEKATITDLSKL